MLARFLRVLVALSFSLHVGCKVEEPLSGTARLDSTTDVNAPSLSIADLTVNEGSGGVTTATFTVTASSISSVDINVDYSTSNGTTALGDYTPASGHITIAPGSTSATINVTVSSDAFYETNESFYVILSGGNGYYAGASKLVAVATIDDDDSAAGFMQVFGGSVSSCGLMANGKAYCWGQNDRGQLGNNGSLMVNQQKPDVAVDTTNLPGGSGFTQIVLLNRAACGLAAGKAFCWGADTNGEIGNGVIGMDQPIPVAVDMGGLAAGTNFVQLSGGMNYACGLTNDGKIFCWGRNSLGELGDGDGTHTDKATPTQVDTSNLAPGTWFTKISTGLGYHTCGITNDGKAYCWGRGLDGEIGDGGTVNRDVPTAVDMAIIPAGSEFLSIAVASESTCGIVTGGNVYCWGDNSSGQVGVAGTHVTPALVDTANLTSGSVFVSLSAGGLRVCGLTDDRKVYCWGSNALTDGTNRPKPTALNITALDAGTNFIQLSAGIAVNCGVTNTAKAYCWGADSTGAVGDGGAGSLNISVPTAVDVSSLLPQNNFIQLSSGYMHFCSLTGDFRAYCWGRDGAGSLGNGDDSTKKASPVNVDMSGLPAGSTFTQITSGGNHSCALTNLGAAYCWGQNDHGEIGDSTKISRSVPTAVSMTPLSAGTYFTKLASGSDHVCGITNSGVAYCWGANSTGQLGTGNLLESLVPKAVSMAGMAVGEKFTDIEAGGQFYASSSRGHVCALTNLGKMYCWGTGVYGQLGFGLTMNKNVPTLVDTSNLAVGARFVKMALGGYHTCAITNDGKLYCWGINANGQLGDGTIVDKSIPTLVDRTNLTIGSSFVSMTAVDKYTCAVASDGKSFCWGDGGYGNLGNGSILSKLVPTAVSLTNLTAGAHFMSIEAGPDTACGIASDAKSYCWGRDDYGQLGNGNGFEVNQSLPLAIDQSAL